MIDRRTSRVLDYRDGQTNGSRALIGTFADTAPNYPRFPYVTKTLDGKEIDKHARRNGFFMEGQSAPRPRPLNDEELLLTTPIVYGFSLNDKHWSTSYSRITIRPRDCPTYDLDISGIHRRTCYAV